MRFSAGCEPPPTETHIPFRHHLFSRNELSLVRSSGMCTSYGAKSSIDAESGQKGRLKTRNYSLFFSSALTPDALAPLLLEISERISSR